MHREQFQSKHDKQLDGLHMITHSSSSSRLWHKAATKLRHTDLSRALACASPLVRRMSSLLSSARWLLACLFSFFQMGSISWQLWVFCLRASSALLLLMILGVKCLTTLRYVVLPFWYIAWNWAAFNMRLKHVRFLILLGCMGLSYERMKNRCDTAMYGMMRYPLETPFLFE